MEIISNNNSIIKEIIEKHKHFINRDCDGWECMAAKLSHEFLPNVDLRGVDLSLADLSYANLSNANLSEANLKGANLTNAILYGANLAGANLSMANLRHAILNGAVLSLSDLRGVDLTHADLMYADLTNADLRGADLTYAILSGAFLDNAIGPLIEYRKGKILTEDIIGYKKCKNDIIVTLKIPKDAIVFSINGTKCRTNKAKVIAIDGSDIAYSWYSDMAYHVGDEFSIHDFNCEYNSECAEGIHFFMTPEEAMNYRL